MCDDDLSSVYRKRTRYEKGIAKKTSNVYYYPDYSSDVLCAVDSGEEFEIDNEESRGEFYKIYTASGIEGFVRKRNIKTER